MRIASVEKVELGNIMGHVLEWARQSNLSQKLSLRKRNGRNVKNHGHLTVVRHLSEKTHRIREGEERGNCSAALKELLKIVEDQIEERSVVVLVLNKDSAIWKDAGPKTLLRGDQLKYIDVERRRVITNNRCVAYKSRVRRWRMSGRVE